MGEGRYVLRGEIVLSSVPALLETSERVFADQPPLDIDLSAVTRADSAGLALLLEWMRVARAAGRQIRFHQVPERLAEMARIGGVAELLPS